jgi:hypothetical protein
MYFGMLAIKLFNWKTFLIFLKKFKISYFGGFQALEVRGKKK